MIKKIKEYFKKRSELKKSLSYYKIVKQGGLFLQFIYNDLEKHKTTLNRETRRRFETYMEKNGKLSQEIVLHYTTKIDEIIKYIELESKKK